MNTTLELFKLSDMVKGWFIGSFEPTLHNTQEVEIGVKEYRAGDYESSHYHKIATEFTVIIRGTVEMNGQKYSEGDIIKIIPNTATDFKAVTDVITVVAKIPGASNDKYLNND